MDRALDLDGARVAILGWAGSTPRQLRGVARWYRERNGVPMVATARIFDAMRRPDGWDREGAALVARMREESREGPWLIHSFSNAGFWMLASALEHLDEPERARLKAVVLDSAPGFPPHIGRGFYVRSASMAMMPLVLRVFRKPPALTHPILTPPLQAFMWVWYHMSTKQRLAAERTLQTVRETGSWPLLFLYSAADELVEARHVEGFLATLGRREVTTKRWADSGHVRHMLDHRVAYFDEVERFLSASL